MSITSDILRGHTEAIILSSLLEQDSYGYQINKDIMKKTNNAYELKEATLYSAFRRSSRPAVSGLTGAMRQSGQDVGTMPSRTTAGGPTRDTSRSGRRRRRSSTSY